jgi:hypothetical protein
MGQEIVAVGFLVFAIGESLLVSGAAMDLVHSAPSFGGGIGLPYLRRRADHGFIATASFLRLSRPRRDIRWVDCDDIAGQCRRGSSVRVKL